MQSAILYHFIYHLYHSNHTVFYWQNMVTLPNKRGEVSQQATQFK